MKRALIAMLIATMGCIGLRAEEITKMDESTTQRNFEQETEQHYTGWVAKVVDWYSHHISYGAVCGLMALESSFVPFPSEVVIPPAVMVAADEERPNGMKIWIIVLAGTLGALIGAYVNYFLSLWLGRLIIYRLADSKVGRMMNLSSEKVQRAEVYFNKHGKVSTLVGRFIPVIRQLISIPAGLARMNFLTFSFYTFIGAMLWNIILAALGYAAVKMGGMNFIYTYSSLLSKIIIGIVAVVCVFFIVRALYKRNKKKARL